MSIYESAMAVHDAGYPLIVVRHGEKGPRTKGWQNKRYTRPELEIKLTSDPTPNVGILLGPESGVIDIECDGPHAASDLAELFTGCEMPATPSWDSTRGEHRLYAWDDRLAEIGKASIHFGDVEIRLGCGKAAQSLIPPSTTAGFTRTWKVPLTADSRPAPLPDVVIERITEHAKRKTVSSDHVAKVVEWLKRGGIETIGTREEDGYTVVRLAKCPKKLHEDGNSGVLVFPDGTISVKCFHAKTCQDLSLADLEAMAGPYDGPRTIIVTADERRVVDQAVAALASTEGIYQRGGQLNRIVRNAPPPPGVSRAPDAPRIEVIPSPALRETLATAAKWMRKTEDGYTRSHVPSWAVAAVNTRGVWPVPVIEAVTNVPLLRSDGSIITKPGFDAATGVYYLPSITYPDVPSVQEAVSLLLEVVRDFPFASMAHRAAWVAAVITPAARLAFTGPSPLFAFDANAPGTGKSLLADATSIIAADREFARMAAAGDDSEWRKRITSIAIAGEPLVLIDNIDGRLGSPALDAALTGTTWSDRLLGVNQTVTVPLLTTWYATGNNIAFGRDTARRTVHIRLECPVERPEERTGFAHPNLLAWVREQRGRLVSAALTILRSYIEAGRPNQKLPPWGSFDGWSDLVRQAIVWAGLDDPGSTRLALAEQADTDLALLRQLLAGWQAADPSGVGLTVSEALDLVDRPKSVQREDHLALLRSAIAEIGGRDRGHALGVTLRKYRGRVADGVMFNAKDHPGKVKAWYVSAPATVAYGNMVVVYDEGRWLAHGPKGIEEVTEDEAHTRLMASGLDAHDARAELRKLRDIGRKRALVPYLIEDARTRRWFIADENGIGRRTTRAMADLLMKWEGTPKRVRDRMFAVATLLPICLCDLAPITVR